MPRARDLGDGFAGAPRVAAWQAARWSARSSFSIIWARCNSCAGQGMDVRPHPHIGLATVTYLFDGSIMHRDSEGNVQEIPPGAMNLMTAGRGIAHSERTPDVQRAERSGDARHAELDRAAGRLKKSRPLPAFRRRRPAAVEDRGVTRARYRGLRVRHDSPVDDGVAVVLRRGQCSSRQQRSARCRDHEERAIYRGRRRSRDCGRPLRGAAPADLPARRPHHRQRRARRG